MNFEDSSKQTVNIPVKIENGQLRYLYGKALPKIKEGAEGNLIILQGEVIDQNFTKKIQIEKKELLFEKGEMLLIALNYDYIPFEKRGNIVKVKDVYPNVPYGFLKIFLETPLFLSLRGTKMARLSDCECKIPELNHTSKSINKAYTKISEAYEIERTSHTANVFKKCFYYDGNTKYWTELDILRERVESQHEKELYFVDVYELESNCRLYLNLSEIEIKVLKCIETFGEISVDKMEDFFGVNRESYINTIMGLVNKGVICKSDWY
jgi:hypothetical protein